MVEAEIAACVLLELDALPHLGPSQCQMMADVSNGTKTTGLMIVDQAFSNAQGREARIYLRFAIPAELAGQTITALTLGLHTADGAYAGGPSGDLHATAAFDLPSLETSAPKSTGMVAPSLDVANDAPVAFVVSPELAVPGAPLHLGLWATSDDGTLFRGLGDDAPARPTLTIFHE